MCGNLKDFVVIAISFYTFGGIRFQLYNALGIAIGMLGSITYAYYKLAEARGQGKVKEGKLDKASGHTGR